MATLIPAERADRDDATAFTGMARWDTTGLIRLRGDGDLVRLWATTCSTPW